MGNPALDELLDHLTDRLAPHLSEVPRETIRAGLAALPESTWDVATDDHLVIDANGKIYDQTVRPEGLHDTTEPTRPLIRHRLIMTLVREETTEESERRQAGMAALLWTPETGPPPPGVTPLRLLRQDVWWRAKTGKTMRIDDMEPNHRSNLVGWLERNASRLKAAEMDELSFFASLNEDTDGTWNHLINDRGRVARMPPLHWLYSMPLMRALLGTGESPTSDDDSGTDAPS